MGFYVPETLRKARRWVVWDETKTPYRADGKGKASPTNPSTWADFDAAINMLKNSEYKGAGFVFVPGDDLVFIDIDDCITAAGELSEIAKSIIDLFPDTYIEYSQSEAGLHIVARGKLPCSGRKIAGVMEIYSAGRYMAFTGNAYTAAEPAEAQEAINELCRRYEIIEAPELAGISDLQRKDGDAEIIERAHNGANGRTFAALWSGDWSSYRAKGKSQSEADYRLLEVLYYYTGDKEQAARLFLQSALGQRAKAMRPDYVPRTLAAIDKRKKSTSESKSATRSMTSRSNLSDTPKPKKKYRNF